MKKFTTLSFSLAVALSLSAATEKNVIISYDIADGQHPGSWGNSSSSEIMTLDSQSVWALTNPSEAANAYNAQFGAYNSTEQPLPKGETIYVAMTVKGSVAGSFNGSLQAASHGYISGMSNVNVSTEWNDVISTGTVSESSDKVPGAIDFNIGKYVGTLYFSHIEVYTLKEVTDDENIEVLSEYDFENGQMPSTWGNSSTKEIITDGTGHVLKFTNPSVTNSYSVQMQLYGNADAPLTPGETYYVSMRIKGSEPTPANIGGYLQGQNYSTNASLSTVSVTNEWNDVIMKATTKSDADVAPATRVVLNLGAYAGDLYFDDIRLYRENTTTGIDVIRSVSISYDNKVYNLQGIYICTLDDLSHLSILPSGIYIINGKKYVVR